MQRSASLAAPYTASDPLFFLPSPLPHTSQCFLEEGVGFLGEEKGTIILFPQLTDLLKRFPLENSWRVLERGIRPLWQKKKKAIAAVQQGYLWSCPSESFMSTHTCTRAHTHAQPRLNKHFKLAGQDHRLFSIWIAGEGRKIVQHSLFGLLVLLRLIQVKEESGTWDTNKTSLYQTNTHAQMLKVSPPLRHLTMTSTQKLLQLERVLRLLSSLTFQHNINTKTHP